MAECPREPGYYWAHNNNGGWTVIEVMNEKIHLCGGGELGMYVDEVEAEGWFDRFIGPLQPPEEEG